MCMFTCIYKTPRNLLGLRRYLKCVCMFMFIYACVYICVQNTAQPARIKDVLEMCMHVYVYICVCYVFTCVSIYLCIFVCTCKHIHIPEWRRGVRIALAARKKHTYIHTHQHTYMLEIFLPMIHACVISALSPTI